MDTSKQFLTFLKTLQTSGNAELLECIEQGFRHVMEGTTHGNIYATQIGQHATPKGDVVGTGVPGPADMCTEEVTKDDETAEKRLKKVVPTCAVDK